MTEIERMKQALRELAKTLTEEQKEQAYNYVKEMGIDGLTPEQYFNSLDPYSKDTTSLQDHQAATNNIFVINIHDSLDTSFDYYLYHSDKTEKQFYKDVETILKSKEVGEQFLLYSKNHKNLISSFDYILYSLIYFPKLGYHLITPTTYQLRGPDILEPISPKSEETDYYIDRYSNIIFRKHIGKDLFNKFVEHNQLLLKKD